MSIYKLSEHDTNKQKSRLDNSLVFWWLTTGTMYMNGYSNVNYTMGRVSNAQAVVKYWQHLLQTVVTYDSYNTYSTMIVVVFRKDSTISSYSRQRFDATSWGADFYLDGDIMRLNYLDAWDYRQELDLTDGTWTTTAGHETTWLHFYNTPVEFSSYTCYSNARYSWASSINYTITPYLRMTK